MSLVASVQAAHGTQPSLLSTSYNTNHQQQPYQPAPIAAAHPSAVPSSYHPPAGHTKVHPPVCTSVPVKKCTQVSIYWFKSNLINWDFCLRFQKDIVIKFHMKFVNLYNNINVKKYQERNAKLSRLRFQKRCVPTEKRRFVMKFPSKVAEEWLGKNAKLPTIKLLIILLQ